MIDKAGLSIYSDPPSKAYILCNHINHQRRNEEKETHTNSKLILFLDYIYWSILPTEIFRRPENIEH